MKQAVTVKNYITFAALILVAQALTAAAILMNIPVLRQVLGFVCFVALLGMVTLPLIKVRCNSAAELLVYSCGLGLIGIMVIGLVLNTLYPFLSQPLSTIPMLVALNFYMCAALAAGFILKRSVPFDFPVQPSRPGSLKYTAVIVLLPVLAILGTWAMNMYGFNLILMLLILAIAVIFIAALVDKDVPEGVYSLLILSASISLLLLYSLRSFYLIGYDVNGEFYTFSLTLANYHWSLSNYIHIYNTCLSITILPTVLYSLLNIDPQYIFKMVFQVAFALLPLAVYIFFKEKIDRRLAFLAAFFMMSNYMFYYDMPSLIRQEVALLLFVLAIFILFTDRIKKEGGVALFLIFSFGTVISHYSTAFIFFFILLATYLAAKYISSLKIESEHRITAPLVIAVFAMILFWDGLVTRITLSAAIQFGIDTLNSINNMLLGVASQQDPIASMVLGNGLNDTLLNLFSWGIGTLGRLAIILGVFYAAYIILFKRGGDNEQWMMFDTEFVMASLILLVLVVAGIFVPYLSVGYNLDRLYMQALVFLAPMFVVGIFAALKNFRVGVTLTAAGALVAIFLICQTGLLYQAFGLAGSVSLNPNDTSGYLVYPQEVAGAQWLADNQSPTHVYADNYASLRLWSYGDMPVGYGYNKSVYVLNSGSYDFRSTQYDMLNSYVYLDYYNVNDGVLYDSWDNGLTPLSNFSDMDRMDQVYDNGGSEVLESSGRGL